MGTLGRTPGIDEMLLRTSGPVELHRTMRARDGILILIAILGAIGSFGGQRDHWWYPYATGAFLLVGVSVLVQGFAWPWFAAQSRSKIRSRRRDRAARELAREFRKLVMQFAILAGAENGNSFCRYFWDLAARDPGWRSKLPATIPPWYFEAFFALFVQRLEDWDGSYEGLKGRAKDFTSVVTQYGQVCVRPMLDALRRLDRDQLPDDIRHKVNLIREDYTAFIRQCRAFAQAANSQCDEQVFPEYLDVPEPI